MFASVAMTRSPAPPDLRELASAFSASISRRHHGLLQPLSNGSRGGSGRSTRPRRSRALLFAQAFIIRQDCYGIGWLLSGWSSGIFPSFKKFGRFPHKILVLAKLKILTSVGFCWPSGYHIGAEPALEEPQKVHLKCFQELYQGLVTNKGVPSIPLEFPMRSKPL